MFRNIGRDVVINDQGMEHVLCDQLIELFQKYPKSSGLLSKETGIYSTATKYYALNLDTNESAKLETFIKDQLANAVSNYQKTIGLKSSIGSVFEVPEIMCYPPDGGQITVHVDSNGSDHTRSLVAIWYLNDVEEGGVLHMPSETRPIEIRPKKGRLIMFPCDWTHYHYVTEVISNPRYSLISFLNYQ
jgi:Rps23 Pro-64 3,4-dihydroxylase Tpa1-like proline 4-hydroxylase